MLPQAELEQTTGSLDSTRSQLEAATAECSSLQGRLTEVSIDGCSVVPCRT